MIKRKVSEFSFVLLIVISLLVILILLTIKETNASSSNQMLAGNVRVQASGNPIEGAEISIIDINGNDIASATTENNGSYQIVKDGINKTKDYDLKFKVQYENIKLNCTGITQKVYELNDNVRSSRFFNVSSVINPTVDSEVYNQFSNILKSMGSNVNVGFGTDLNLGVEKLGDELLRTDVTSVIIYFGTMTQAERDARQQSDSRRGEKLEIIELGDIKDSYQILEKLAEKGYIKTTTTTITPEVNDTEGYIYARNIKIGNNVKVDCEFEIQEIVPTPPPTPPQDLGSGATEVIISGRITRDSIPVSDLNNMIKLTVKDDSNTKVAYTTLSLDGNGEYSIQVKLDFGKNYYIEYEFMENAFNLGYSTQEYYINKPGTDDNTSRLVTKTVNGDDKYITISGNTRREDVQYAYKKIDETKETELDTYCDNTKLMARTEIFTIDKWQENPIDFKQTTNIVSSLNLITREQIEISLEKHVSGVKIVLQDGTVFLEDKAPTFVGSGIDKFKMIHMDDEIIHGATVFVEYTLKANIEDISNILQTVTVRDLLDDVDTYGKKRNIYYNPDCQLITEDNTNFYYGWEIVENTGNTEIRGILTKAKNVVKIVTSQVITQECEAAYSNIAYIESYETTKGKRNGSWNNYRRAGNKNETQCKSEEVKILPPFGKKVR